MRFEAHSFLTVGPWDIDRRLVVPLAGFAWGFQQDSQTEGLRISPLRVLGPADWDGHRSYLAERYPGWKYDEGGHFARHDQGSRWRPAN